MYVVFRCENKAICFPRRARDSTSGKLHKTSAREKSRGVYSPIGRVFPSYSMIFRFCWTWEDYACLRDSLICAAKVGDCVISAWCWQVCEESFNCGFAKLKSLCQALISFRRCLALSWSYLGKETLDSRGKIWSTMGDKSSWDTFRKWHFWILKHLLYFICS